MFEIRLKKTSGKTWSNLTSDDIITPEVLKEIGEILVESIVREAGKDFAKQGNSPTPQGIAEGVPRTLNFFDSFSYKTDKSKSTVDILSSWPWIQQIMEGTPPYPMTWLTRAAGVSKVPMKQPGGTVLIRSTPATPDKAWIHPGFKKHTFVKRGYQNALRRVNKLVFDAAAKTLKDTPIG